MKLVIDLPDSLIGRVKKAVQSGGYENAREFVTTSIENQLELEEAEGDETAFKTLDDAIEEIDETETETTEQETLSGQAELDSNDLLADGLGRRTYDAVRTVPSPDASRLDDGPLWGQYNRVFPTKIVVRRLANLIQEQNSEGVTTSDNGLRWVDLDQFQEETAQLARNYGLTIKEYDEKKSRGRGEKIASGLPTGDDAEKSKDRFKTHFVGYSDRNQNLTGEPAHLHFVDISDEEITRIGITEAGLSFASLHNPLLDDGPDADSALSSDEQEFYLEHTREHLRDEYRAMAVTARAISEGDDRPDSLTRRIGELDEEWSQSKAGTMRSGLTSRMYELELVDRRRVGQRGTAYTLTEKGESLLSAADGVHTD